jgi:hypothetical protein
MFRIAYAQIQAKTRHSSLLHTVQNGPGAYPAFYSILTGGKAAGTWM